MGKQTEGFVFKKDWKYKLEKFFFSIIGDIAYYGWRHPLWLMYQPCEHAIKGDDLDSLCRLIYEGGLQPGDIFLNRHDHYLSTFAIAGDMIHAGLYVGNVPWKDGKLRHTVIHAMSEGVFAENAIHFFRADHGVILRPRLDEKFRMQAATKCFEFLGRPYDFDFRYTNTQALYCTELIGASYDLPEIKEKFKFTLVEQSRLGIKRTVLKADNVFLSDVDLIWYSKDVPKMKVYQAYMAQQKPL